MKTMPECTYETEVLDALASRRWPARAGEELREHVAQCSSCADLADVAGALLADDDVAYSAARVPTAASVWHRAQLRAREEAVRAATRPIGFVQGVACVAAVAAVAATGLWGLPILMGFLPDWPAIGAALRMPSISLPRIDLDTAALLSNTTLQIAVAVWAVLAPLALYVTLRDTNS